MRKTKQNRKRHVTLRDVAFKAGVSLTTVSNFVNNRHSFMSSETRQKVKLTIEELNYRPHGIARSLRLAEWHSIGIIIVDESPTYLADYITTYIIAGLSNFLTGNGYNLVVQGLRAAIFESSPLVSHLRTDGLCVMLSGSRIERRSLLDILLQLNQPVVLFQDTFRPRGADVCTVMQDDEQAGYELASHVVQRGSSDIVFLVPPFYEWAGIEARLRGIRDYLSHHSIHASVRTVICGGTAPADIWQSLDSDFRANGTADAVLCNTDEMALAVCKYLHDTGRRIPEDVKVTGYNSISLRMSAIPTLTSVPSRGYELGELAGEVMLSRLRLGRFVKRRINLPLSLLLGQST